MRPTALLVEFLCDNNYRLTCRSPSVSERWIGKVAGLRLVYVTHNNLGVPISCEEARWPHG